MRIKDIYLSAPQISLPKQKFDNKEIIGRVQDNFKGSKLEFKKIKSGISFVFRYCDTDLRYLGTETGKKPLDYAVEASRIVCEKNNIDPSSLDLVIYGGIFREYFEPSTAMEIASRLNIDKAHVFDVTTACAGMLQAVNTAASFMMADPSINTALCCTTDFPAEAIDYNIQSFEELSVKAAGLTLGSAASAWILTRKPLVGGSVKLIEIQNTSVPKAYDLCQVSVKNRKFSSQSKEVFDLGLEYVPEEIKKVLKNINWSIDEIDYFISHQPSKKIIYQICDILKIDRKKAPVIHHLYGNTVNSSVPMVLDHILSRKELRNKNKILLSSAAAGFTMLTIAAEWIE